MAQIIVVVKHDGVFDCILDNRLFDDSKAAHTAVDKAKEEGYEYLIVTVYEKEQEEDDESDGEGTIRIGDTVCVRDGVTDYDFPEISIGSFVGTVIDIDVSGIWVKWDDKSFALFPDWVKSECDRRGLGGDMQVLNPDDVYIVGRSDGLL